MEFLTTIILPLVFIVVGVLLAFLIWKLLETVKNANDMVVQVNKSLVPTMQNLEVITGNLQSATEKIDPLVERVALTVDAANLEIMRVDKILEDVSQVTETASAAAGSIDTITKAPANLVTTISDKVSNLLAGRRSSDTSARLAEQNAAREAEEPALEPKPASAPAPVPEPEPEPPLASEPAPTPEPEPQPEPAPAQKPQPMATFAVADAPIPEKVKSVHKGVLKKAAAPSAAVTADDQGYITY